MDTHHHSSKICDFIVKVSFVHIHPFFMISICWKACHHEKILNFHSLILFTIFLYTFFFLFLFLFVTFFSPFLFLFLTFLIENISRNRVSYVYYIDKRLRNLVIVSKILLIIIFPQNYCKINTIFIIFNLFIYPTICFQRLTHTVVPIFESWQIFFST